MPLRRRRVPVSGWWPPLVYLATALLAIAHRTTTRGYASSAFVWTVSAIAVAGVGLHLACHLRESSAPRRPRTAHVLAFLCSTLPAMAVVIAVASTRLGFRELTTSTAGIASLCAAVLLYGAVGLSMAQRAGTGRRSGPGGVTWGLALPLVALPLVWIGAWIVPPSRAATHPSNVLLIGIDTLRWDDTALGATPAERDLTPQLRRLAQRGTVFTRAISQAPWTMPAFASVMTGEYPREHGAISLTGLLRDSETTIAEVLREAGYTTGAVVSHMFVDARHGFGQGFDGFDQANVLGERAVTSRAVTDHAISFLARHRDERSFLFVHYFDPHFMYRDHPDLAYADDYQGWLRKFSLSSIDFLRDRRHHLAAADVQYLRDLYDEEIRYTDEQIGRLLGFMQRSGLQRNTIIIVVADHGEEFLEHGWLGHTISLHDEVIHVPMLLVQPAGDGDAGPRRGRPSRRSGCRTLRSGPGRGSGRRRCAPAAGSSCAITSRRRSSSTT